MRNTANINELILTQPDFIGLIFHEASPRNVTETPQTEIPSSTQKVGVFVNKKMNFITEKALNYGLNYIQLHGKESPEFCKSLTTKGFKIIKAFNISKDFNFKTLTAYESFCEYFLFDAFGKQAGGNGIVFNWELLDNYNGATPFLLSGGINESMVEEIKKFKHPQFIGIDINSGFEKEPALKNIKKIKEFKQELRQ